MQRRVCYCSRTEHGIGAADVRANLNAVVEINRRGVSILLVRAKMPSYSAISNAVYVLETGSVVLSGSGRELLNNDKSDSSYLGVVGGFGVLMGRRGGGCPARKAQWPKKTVGKHLLEHAGLPRSKDVADPRPRLFLPRRPRMGSGMTPFNSASFSCCRTIPTRSGDVGGTALAWIAPIFRNLTRMVRSGLVGCSPSQQDRRAKSARLTATRSADIRKLSERVQWSHDAFWKIFRPVSGAQFRQDD